MNSVQKFFHSMNKELSLAYSSRDILSQVKGMCVYVVGLPAHDLCKIAPYHYCRKICSCS